MLTPKIRLVARNQGIEVIDPSGRYGFDVAQNGNVWTVFTPGSRWAGASGPVDTSTEDEERVLPQVISFLERIWWFGILPRSYSVRIEKRAP